MIQNVSKILRNVAPRVTAIRTMTHYPIDDVMFGLTEEQIAVINDFKIIIK